MNVNWTGISRIIQFWQPLKRISFAPALLLIAPFSSSVQPYCGIYKVQWAANVSLETSGEIEAERKRDPSAIISSGRVREWGVNKKSSPNNSHWLKGEKVICFIPALARGAPFPSVWDPYQQGERSQVDFFECSSFFFSFFYEINNGTILVSAVWTNTQGEADQRRPSVLAGCCYG